LLGGYFGFIEYAGLALNALCEIVIALSNLLEVLLA
jgi:hypothetical protein